jgi:hypothetical protein
MQINLNYNLNYRNIFCSDECGGMNVDLSSLDNVNFNRWNRRILNVYWIIVALSVVVAILQLKFTHWDPQYYITRYIVLPTVILVTFMLITEAIQEKIKQSFFLIRIKKGFNIPLNNYHLFSKKKD